MSGIDLTLSSIDAALADTSVSHDAMRSIPEPEAVALHLGVDNTIAHVPLRPGQTLKDLYAVIDCRSVDCVQLNDTYDMWIDDEGLYTGRMNILATALARVFGLTHQYYYGDVVIARSNSEGQTLPLKPADFRHLGALLGGFFADDHDDEDDD